MPHIKDRRESIYGLLRLFLVRVYESCLKTCGSRILSVTLHPKEEKVMIASFYVSNYRSIWRKQSISFVSTPDKSNRDLLSVEVAKGVYINKLAIFFGANASGKSNMLEALEALFMIMCMPSPDKKRPISQYCPFALDKESPTAMGIEFYFNGIRYLYDVRFNGDFIEEENLFYVPSRNKALFYTRKYVGPDAQPSIDFGTTLKLSSKTKETIRETTFNNHSVLSTIAKLSLKEDANDLKLLYNWVVNHVHNINGDSRPKYYVSELNKINSDIRKKEFYIKLLSKADFNITDFKLVDNKANLPKEFVNEIINSEDIPEERRVAMLNTVVFTNHSENGSFDISLDSQSGGTLRFIELLEALYDLVTDSHIYFLDELGNRMHYDLIVYYLILFLHNSEASQMFFTSQSILLLDEDFIRRDIVYLTEKDLESASTSYTRVSDMGLHKNLSLYNAYRIGKLGSRPDLGSPYLNLSK